MIGWMTVHVQHVDRATGGAQAVRRLMIFRRGEIVHDICLSSEMRDAWLKRVLDPLARPSEGSASP